MSLFQISAPQIKKSLKLKQFVKNLRRNNSEQPNHVNRIQYFAKEENTLFIKQDQIYS